ncbi:MAG: glycosyltransferase [Scytolyngbya sp. HA4215-MV1]|jgi:glycosyltransferase involved in cell wall biosynthesis|nr:glycosyltransferase [Scytolyngbya sp. HA4215-MV1]
MKVALVHDYLREYGDAERVLAALHRLYPQAPVYTAFVDLARLGTAAGQFADWEIRSTFAQHLPLITRNFRAYKSWLPYFWESLDLSEFDLVISSSGEYLSHAVLTGAETLHISYCHTPARDLWEPAHAEAGNRWLRLWRNTHLRHYDFYTTQRVDRFITNSQRVARRIKKFYGCTAEVIPPPIKIHGKGKAGEQYYLYVGQLERHQQVDLAIAACQQLARPLWVVGSGDEAERLKREAGDRIRFLGNVSESHLPELYADARALIFPATDADFGFSPIEAMGHGVPVIASAQSGIREIILNYRTGLLFSQPTVDSLCATITQFEGLRFSAYACIERAEEFSESVFMPKLKWFIAQAIDDHQQHHTATKS